MTRCACAGVGFDEIAWRIDAERLSLDEAARATGCGQICSACIPDLHSFLQQRG
jgi:bacterioferritin-associated ferredoxin